METQDRDTFKASEALAIAARVWLFLALAAMMLAIVVQAIEQHQTSVYIMGVKQRPYQVPIVEEDEKTRHYHDIKGEHHGDG